MAAYIQLDGVTKTFGLDPLFEGLTAQIHKGDTIGIVGPNGAGKSTLLKLIFGDLAADGGQIVKRKNLKIAYVHQELPLDPQRDVRDALEQHLIDTYDAKGQANLWASMAISVTRLNVEGRTVSQLSGGEKKRLAIACAHTSEPDIMLLDEPTNHLDLEGILWLEQLLSNPQLTFLVVSHDRYFLDRVSATTWEISSLYEGGLFVSAGNYSQFVINKDDYLAASAKQLAALTQKAKREQEFLRAGVKARTTKARYRIDAAYALFEQRAALNERLKTSTAQLSFGDSQRKTKKLLSMENLGHSYDDGPLFKDLNLTVLKGQRIGVVGPNGCGKSTLLKIIMGQVKPAEGTIDEAPLLQKSYFDQHKQQLDLSATVKDVLSDGDEKVVVMGREIHVMSYASRFLFSREQLDHPVDTLSGGEKARLMASKLLRQNADVLILDEPTNDLDLDTLAVLEQSLQEFTGAIIMVSHDRYFLEQVCTTILGYDGEGQFRQYGDYAQWQKHFAAGLKKKLKGSPEGDGDDDKSKNAGQSKGKAKAKSGSSSKRLSYMDQREFDGMEETIAKAEAEVETLTEATEAIDPGKDSLKYQEAFSKLQAAQQKVQDLYDRWAELEAQQS